MEKRKRVLIDCDPGVDDSIALLYALLNKNFKVEAITIGAGNCSVEDGGRNAADLVKLSGVDYDIDIALGTNETLDQPIQGFPSNIHGKNGIGNFDLEPSAQKPVEKKAWEVIVDKAKEFENELIIITLGRYTNLAKALELDPDLPHRVSQVISMGGVLNDYGNVGARAEANVAGDARASDIVFTAGFNLMLVGMDVTTKTFIEKKDFEVLRKYSDPKHRKIIDYLEGAAELYFRFYYDSAGFMDRMVVHDPLALLLTQRPGLGVYELHRCRVEYESEEFRGLIKTDERFSCDWNHKPILICTGVDSDAAVRELWSIFK